MAKVEQLLEDAYDDVKADVVAQIKAHPSYPQLVAQLADQGFAELVKLIATAA